MKVDKNPSLATSTRWQTFSVGNLHGHEEYSILVGLNENFQFCFEEKPRLGFYNKLVGGGAHSNLRQCARHMSIFLLVFATALLLEVLRVSTTGAFHFIIDHVTLIKGHILLVCYIATIFL